MAMFLTKYKFIGAISFCFVAFAGHSLCAQTTLTLLVKNFAEAASSLPPTLRDNGGIITLSEFKEVERAGPNSLPFLFKHLEEETDAFVQMAIKMAIKRNSLYHQYRYLATSKNPSLDSALLTTPLLTQAVDKKGLFVNHNDDQIKMWWHLRHTLINRKQSMLNWGRLEESAKSDNALSVDLRLYEAEMTLGIFNLPVVVKSIAEHNSAVAFNEFLRLSHSPLYAQVCPTGEWSNCFANADKAVPTRVAKLQLIKDWWAHSAKTFTELPQLHAAIESEVSKFRE